MASGSLERLVEAFAKFPGIGKRTAERLAYHVLRSPKEEAQELISAITDLKQKVQHCHLCYNLSEEDPCAICSNDQRDVQKILVVEQPSDVRAFEETGLYQGLYHVLMGRVSPLDGVGPEDITLTELVDRVKQNGVKEIILATNPDLGGDGTALHIQERLKNTGAHISRLARGLATGSTIEHANRNMLADALEGRRQI